MDQFAPYLPRTGLETKKTLQNAQNPEKSVLGSSPGENLGFSNTNFSYDIQQYTLNNQDYTIAGNKDRK
jgi:hypothetical protein